MMEVSPRSAVAVIDRIALPKKIITKADCRGRTPRRNQVHCLRLHAKQAMQLANSPSACTFSGTLMVHKFIDCYYISVLRKARPEYNSTQTNEIPRTQHK
jgi:hypothetical protein